MSTPDRARMSAMLHLPADIAVGVREDKSLALVTVSIEGAPSTGDCYTGVTLFFPDRDAFDRFVADLIAAQTRRLDTGSYR